MFGLLCQPADEVDAEESKKGHHLDQKFADVMAQKTDAVSEFAKKKSYREQRQYLPIFAVRNEVSVSLHFKLQFYAFCIVYSFSCNTAIWSSGRKSIRPFWSTTSY